MGSCQVCKTYTPMSMHIVHKVDPYADTMSNVYKDVQLSKSMRTINLPSRVCVAGRSPSTGGTAGNGRAI